MGHSWYFHVDETTLVWTCERCAHHGGQRQYPSHHAARRYARALNRSKPGPPLGMLAAMGGVLARRPPRRVDHDDDAPRQAREDDGHPKGAGRHRGGGR